jgi:hypothetical protein
MSTPGDTVYVALNRADTAATISGLPNGMLDELLEGTSVMGSTITVPPRQARILVAR